MANPVSPRPNLGNEFPAVVTDNTVLARPALAGAVDMMAPAQAAPNAPEAREPSVFERRVVQPFVNAKAAITEFFRNILSAIWNFIFRARVAEAPADATTLLGRLTTLQNGINNAEVPVAGNFDMLNADELNRLKHLIWDANGQSSMLDGFEYGLDFGSHILETAPQGDLVRTAVAQYIAELQEAQANQA